MVAQVSRAWPTLMLCIVLLVACWLLQPQGMQLAYLDLSIIGAFFVGFFAGARA